MLEVGSSLVDRSFVVACRRRSEGPLDGFSLQVGCWLASSNSAARRAVSFLIRVRTMLAAVNGVSLGDSSVNGLICFVVNGLIGFVASVVTFRDQGGYF